MSTANGIDDTVELRRLLARIMIQEFPALALLNLRTYRVIKVYNGSFDYGRCDLALETDPEQQLPRVDQWPGIPGGVGLPVVGSLCEVTWRGGEQKTPVIVGFQPLRAQGGLPDELKIDALTIKVGPSADHVQLAPGPSAILSGVARIGDTVNCGFLTATMVAGVPVISVAPGPASATVVAVVGTITSGSAKVTSA